MNDEKKTVTAWAVRTALQRITESGPNGQYFVNVSKRVIGVVKTQSVRSARARVAIRVFLAVLISKRAKILLFFPIDKNQSHIRNIQIISPKTLFLIDRI